MPRKPPCDPDEILNPDSGFCVKRSGKKGKEILKALGQQAAPGAQQKRPCKADEILNPASGKCVKRTGKIGKKLLKTQGMQAPPGAQLILPGGAKVPSPRTTMIPRIPVSGTSDARTAFMGVFEIMQANLLQRKESNAGKKFWVIMTIPADVPRITADVTFILAEDEDGFFMSVMYEVNGTQRARNRIHGKTISDLVSQYDYQWSVPINVALLRVLDIQSIRSMADFFKLSLALQTTGTKRMEIQVLYGNAMKHLPYEDAIPTNSRDMFNKLFTYKGHVAESFLNMRRSRF